MREHILMHNIDCNTVVVPFLDRVAAGAAPTRQDLYPFVDQNAGTDITDILFCIFCQFSMVDSAVFTDYAGKYLQTRENGFAVNYKKEYGAVYTLNRQHGLDPFGVWIARTRQNGQRAWISLRMNDCHDPWEDTSFLRSDFYYEVQKNGWAVGPTLGRFPFRPYFNYAVPQVRQKMLDYIREQLAHYDVDGLELDFQREIVCFDYVNNPDCHRIMTDFVRQVRGLVEEAAASWGHKIQLGVRLARDIAQNKIYGFDAVAWAQEQLVDVIIVTPRWASNDDDMPLAAWKAALPQVTVLAGLEVLVNRQCDEAFITADVARALAGKYLDKGADGVYMFNLFIGHGDDHAAHDAQFREIYRTCATLDKILSHSARYVVLWQDIAPEGCAPYHPLPLALAADGAW